MRVLIDACVLFPTVLRELVLDTSDAGVFQPLWSERILEEWRRAATRLSDSDGMIAESEIALIKSRFPKAMVAASEPSMARLHLPDPDDVHVLAAAIDGRASELLTLNLKDFPTRTLSAEGIVRRDPDSFLLEAFHADAEAMRAVIDGVLQRAGAVGIDVSNPRAILKKARVPRLAKAFTA